MTNVLPSHEHVALSKTTSKPKLNGPMSWEKFIYWGESRREHNLGLVDFGFAAGGGHRPTRRKDGERRSKGTIEGDKIE